MTTLRIVGNPISRKSNRSKPSASEKTWQGTIASQTKGRLPVTSPCKATIRFRIANWSGKHGPDLDNLLKPLFDGLKSTILPKPTEDSVIYEVRASKKQVSESPGVDIYLYLIDRHTNALKPAAAAS